MASSLVEQITQTEDLQSVKKLLTKLNSSLHNNDDVNVNGQIETKQRHPSIDQNDPELNFLRSVKLQSNPIPLINVNEFLGFDKDFICKFVLVIFHKLYSWTEKCSSDDAMNYESVLDKTQVECRQEVNWICEGIIAW